MSALGTLYRKEITDALRDRRTLVLMLLVPVVIYPAILPVTGLLIAAGIEKLSKAELTVALCSPEAEALLHDRSSTVPHTTFVPMDRAQAELQLRDEKVAALLMVDPGATDALSRPVQGHVTIGYSKRFDASGEARDRLKKLFDGLNHQTLENRLRSAKLEAGFLEPLKVEEHDLELEDNLALLMLASILPVLLTTMLFTGAFNTAIDITAGEKERGTLETLLLAPVRPSQVMAAKYLTVLTVTLLTVFLNLGTMLASFRWGVSLGDETPKSVNLHFGQVALIAFGLLPAAALASALSLALASLSRTVKEGQAMLTPLLMVTLVPSIASVMPGLELTTGTALVPLLNVALLAKAAVLGSARPLLVVLTVGSVGLLAFVAILMAGNAFRSEALRFGGAEGWKDLFRFK
jgi:sodium transport system permease protein